MFGLHRARAPTSVVYSAALVYSRMKTGGGRGGGRLGWGPGRHGGAGGLRSGTARRAAAAAGGKAGEALGAATRTCQDVALHGRSTVERGARGREQHPAGVERHGHDAGGIGEGVGAMVRRGHLLVRRQRPVRRGPAAQHPVHRHQQCRDDEHVEGHPCQDGCACSGGGRAGESCARRGGAGGGRPPPPPPPPQPPPGYESPAALRTSPRAPPTRR